MASPSSAAPTKKKIPDDGWRPMEDMPEDDVSILFIEGYCAASWMQEHFLKKGKTQGMFPFDGCKRFRVWVTDPQYLSPEDTPPDAFGIERCLEEISSGKYHAIVVVDLATSEDDFQDKFGEYIQAFCQNGGVVAFPSSESVLVQTLRDLFGVTWKRSDYYRTTWSACSENKDLVNYSFGNGNFSRRIIQDYSTKGNTLRGVPPHERCFGVSSTSTTQSHVPMMNGRSVAPEDGADDYDVVVAMHEYGEGVIAYFGDVNGEDITIQLVAGFVQSRAPKLPIDCFAGISDDDFEKIKSLKDRGNESFKQGRLEEAIHLYKSLLAIYGTKLGSHGSQREVHVNLYSNVSLIYFKQGKWLDAETAATKGIEVQDEHSKCRFRRAKARLKISREAKSGDLGRLRGAESDLVRCSRPGDDHYETARKLMLSIEGEIKRLKKKEREAFSKGFGKAFQAAAVKKKTGPSDDNLDKSVIVLFVERVVWSQMALLLGSSDPNTPLWDMLFPKRGAKARIHAHMMGFTTNYLSQHPEYHQDAAIKRLLEANASQRDVIEKEPILKAMVAELQRYVDKEEHFFENPE